ncbi:DNA-binding protein P3A2-like isoform X2 [Planococcus citri]|uniref:DNA-binding protein P3A2-like isoform X2 n=1 Tax=Planococcus citri TaxID=170843 RepID=UPI0031F78652
MKGEEEPMVTMMEVSSNVAVQNNDGRRLTINGGSDMEAEISLTVIPQSDDDDDGGMSSDSNHSQDDYSGTSVDLMAAAMGDDVTAQLAAAGWQKQHLHGPVGMAAAAAIVSAKKRKRPHSFETNPSIRKRQQNRLLRKLRQTIDEFSTRVGQQAVVLVATPGKENSGFKCFGAKPLEDVMKNLKNMIMEELEHALSQHAPPPVPDDPSLYELPPLILDGIPTPVEKMTQAQLRAFIPLMLKYSTGRGKPGWGRESTRPVWWPKELPWANVRMDARTEQEKQKISWTKALRQIVINCYKYHGREDLLPVFTEDEEQPKSVNVNSPQSTSPQSNSTSVLKYTSNVKSCPRESSPTTTQVSTQYTPAVLQTISNPDGTVSIIQVDPNNPIITLPDGTTAHVQGVATLHPSQGENGPTVHSVQSLADVAASQGEVTSVDFNNVTEAALSQEGQIILTSEDGHVSSELWSYILGGRTVNNRSTSPTSKTSGYPVSVSGMLTVPVSASMYQTVVANIQQINNDGTVQVTPIVHVPKIEPGTPNVDGSNLNGGGNGEVETITVAPHQVITMAGSNGEQQVLQVISIKDANALKALTGVSVNTEIKTDEPQTITPDAQ